MIGLFSNRITNVKKLHEIIKPTDKVFCISGSNLDWQKSNPTEFNEGSKYYEEQYEQIAQYNIKRKNYYILNLLHTKEYVLNRYKESNIIILLGGGPENLYHIIKEYDLESHIKNDNKILLGISAGAMLLCDHFYILPFIDENYNFFKQCKGLELVHDIALFVHYEHSNPYHDINKKWLEINKLKNEKIILLSDNNEVILE